MNIPGHVPEGRESEPLKRIDYYSLGGSPK
jgi:hypothetical protein